MAKLAKYFGVLFGICALSGSADGVTPRQTPSVAYSPAQVRPLQAGDSVPDVSLTNADGLEFPLSRLLKNQPTVLIFYRGGWCVYCNAQLGQLKGIEKDLQKLGYQIVAVSPDKVEKIRSSLKKYNLGYMLLSDPEAKAIQAFGLAYLVDDATFSKYKEYGLDLEKESGAQHHLLPVPAAYVVDQSGKIHWAYYNPDYKVRVDAQALLQAAAAAAADKRKL